MAPAKRPGISEIMALIEPRPAGRVWLVGDFHEKAGRVKPFFGSCYSYSRLPTNGRHSLAFSPSFLERFLFGHRYSRSPTSGRRTVFAFPPATSIADSPHFHPHSLVELHAPVPAGVLNL